MILGMIMVTVTMVMVMGVVVMGIITTSQVGGLGTMVGIMADMVIMSHNPLKNQGIGNDVEMMILQEEFREEPPQAVAV